MNVPNLVEVPIECDDETLTIISKAAALRGVTLQEFVVTAALSDVVRVAVDKAEALQERIAELEAAINPLLEAWWISVDEGCPTDDVWSALDRFAKTLDGKPGLVVRPRTLEGNTDA